MFPSPFPGCFFRGAPCLLPCCSFSFIGGPPSVSSQHHFGGPSGFIPKASRGSRTPFGKSSTQYNRAGSGRGGFPTKPGRSRTHSEGDRAWSRGFCHPCSSRPRPVRFSVHSGTFGVRSGKSRARLGIPKPGREGTGPGQGASGPGRSRRQCLRRQCPRAEQVLPNQPDPPPDQP